MEVSIVLFSMIFAGFILCAVYLFAEYLTWRRQKAKDLHHEIMLGELHADRMIGSRTEPTRPGADVFYAHPSALRQSARAFKCSGMLQIGVLEINNKLSYALAHKLLSPFDSHLEPRSHESLSRLS